MLEIPEQAQAPLEGLAVERPPEEDFQKASLATVIGSEGPRLRACPKCSDKIPPVGFAAHVRH